MRCDRCVVNDTFDSVSIGRLSKLLLQKPVSGCREQLAGDHLVIVLLLDGSRHILD